LAANAETIRPGEVLYTGDVLIIPTPGSGETTDTESVDSGASIANPTSHLRAKT
jgi:hypothetical protein